MSHAFHIVDVFASEPYAGNPLAVVLDADELAPETMLKITAEMNYSESTFVLSRPEPDGGHRVRMFTPVREIAFAGHPILGTAWVIRLLAPDPPDAVSLNLPVGRVPVTFEQDARGREVAWLLAPPVTLGPVCAPGPLAAALHLAPEDLEPRMPVQVAGAGVSALIVPLRHRAALVRARLDLEAFAPLAGQGFPPLVYLFCPEPRDPENHLCARFFFEANGAREDPATGNAATFLGAYLLEHGYFPQGELDLRIEQGCEVGRPSLVLLRARRDGAGVHIQVGGTVVATAEGRLFT